MYLSCARAVPKPCTYQSFYLPGAFIRSPCNVALLLSYPFFSSTSCTTFSLITLSTPLSPPAIQLLPPYFTPPLALTPLFVNISFCSLASMIYSLHPALKGLTSQLPIPLTVSLRHRSLITKHSNTNCYLALPWPSLWSFVLIMYGAYFKNLKTKLLLETCPCYQR